MIIAPHIDPPLARIPEILSEMNLTAFQTTLRDPKRLSKEGIPGQEDQDAYAVASKSIDGIWGMAHASMLVNIASADPRIRNGSAGSLASDANLAAELGLAGVCFHVGYQKGHPDRKSALDAVVYKLTDVLKRLKPGAHVWLENGCEGSELGQNMGDIGYIFRNLGEDCDREKLGLVIDTCHLHVAGFDLAAEGAADRLADQLVSEGLDVFLRAVHLNDAKEPCGSHRDRHAPPGLGTIAEGLRRVANHPMFSGLPAVMEIAIEEVPAAAQYLCG